MTPEPRRPMTMDDAVLWMRDQPAYADLIRDAYLSADVRAAAIRFRQSAEFAAVLDLIGDTIQGSAVMDLGAGNGIASYAFAVSGAQRVYAVDRDPSDLVGLGTIAQLPAERIEPILARGEDLPLPDESIDIVYTRQVLHHAESLPDFLNEIARVLRPGGALVATREHVAESAQDLAIFLANHPTHPLTGGEHAFPLGTYLSAIEGAGLVLDRIIGPWESVINAFPAARSQEELNLLPRLALIRRFGRAGAVLASLPGVAKVAGRYLHRRRPGEMFSFVASKQQH